MPLYEYSCSQHGTFEAMRSMSESAAPGCCPGCRAESPRILSSVRGAQLPHSQVVARDRNERSQHEPRVMRAQKPAAARDPGARLPVQRSHGSRPWVLEHG